MVNDLASVNIDSQLLRRYDDGQVEVAELQNGRPVERWRQGRDGLTFGLVGGMVAGLMGWWVGGGLVFNILASSACS